MTQDLPIAGGVGEQQHEEFYHFDQKCFIQPAQKQFWQIAAMNFSGISLPVKSVSSIWEKLILSLISVTVHVPLCLYCKSSFSLHTVPSNFSFQVHISLCFALADWQTYSFILTSIVYSCYSIWLTDVSMHCRSKEWRGCERDTREEERKELGKAADPWIKQVLVSPPTLCSLWLGEIYDVMMLNYIQHRGERRKQNSADTCCFKEKI